MNIDTFNGTLTNVEMLVIKKHSGLPIDCLYGMNLLKFSHLNFVQQTISLNIPEGNVKNEHGITMALVTDKIQNKNAKYSL